MHAMYSIVTLGKEIHALSSASKPYSSWVSQSTIQECREACGGLGYLKGTYIEIFKDIL